MSTSEDTKTNDKAKQSKHKSSKSKFKSKPKRSNSYDSDMGSILDRNAWKPIPPLYVTTFPLVIFVIYMLLTLLLLPIYIILIASKLIIKLFMYFIHKCFYYPANSKLTPIIAKPENYVVITGAASGIGKDMTLIYAKKGFSIVLIDVDPTVKEYAKWLKQKYATQHFPSIVHDLSQEFAAEDIYHQITSKPTEVTFSDDGSDDDSLISSTKHKINNNNNNVNSWGIENVVILVNNAGFGMTGEFLNLSYNQMTTMCKVNSLSCMQLGYVFGRHFIKRGVGRICQIASIAAYTPGPHAAVYHATKAFARIWALGLQHELLGTGVGVTVVCPGAVNTNFAKQSHSDLSLIFTKLSFLTYTSMQIAKYAVDATLKGKREVFVGPLWQILHGFLQFYGETYNIVASKFMWSNPEKKSRSPYASYDYDH